MCIYNYVNMSNSSSKVLVSVEKTDYFDCMSLANFWMERGVVAGSHHSPESAIKYIKKNYRENVKEKN